MISYKTASHSNRSSKGSSKSNSSAGSKSDKIEGKINFAELFAQEVFFRKTSANKNWSTKANDSG